MFRVAFSDTASSFRSNLWIGHAFGLPQHVRDAFSWDTGEVQRGLSDIPFRERTREALEIVKAVAEIREATRIEGIHLVQLGID